MKINIYHSNDIHSEYSNLSNIFSYLKEHKTENDFYFDSGDFTDLKDLIVQSDKGVSAIEILNSCGLDAMTIGNNEIDLGKDDLIKTAAKTTMVSCNITDADKKKIPGIHDFLIMEKCGIRFLVIGISPYYSRTMEDNNFNGFFKLYGLNVHPSIELIKEIIRKNKGNYDFCILLAHNGLTVETAIMDEIPEIDLVLGGHSHSEVAEGKYNQTGVFAKHLGIVTLEVKNKDIRIVHNELIDLPECNDSEYDEILDAKRKKADEILSVPIESSYALEFDAYKECQLINFVSDALYKHFEADFALMHNGIANFSLTYPVTRKMLIECFPSKLNPTIFKVKGSILLEEIKRSFDEEFIHQEGKGAGFRGYTLGTLSYSHNVKIIKEPLQVFINEDELDPDREYTMVTDDYIQRGVYYTGFKTADENCFWHVWFIRDLMYNYITDKEIYETSKKRRTY